MKVTTKSLIGVISALVIASSAFASIKSDLQAQYNKVCAVFRTADFAKIKKTLMDGSTKDFKMTGVDGKTKNAEESMKELEMYMKMTKSIDKCDATVVSVKQSGNTAIVTAKMHMKMKVTGMDPKDKKIHTLEEWSTTTDKWVKVNGKWKMASMKTVASKMMMDGKPFDPMAGG